MSANSQRVIQRRLKLKLLCIEFLGGKCLRCGWAEHPSGFDIHHVNPDKKEFALGSSVPRRWSVIEVELRKCILLCSCCHRIVHATNEAFFLDERNIPAYESMDVPENRIRTAMTCVDCGTEIGFSATRCKPCCGKDRIASNAGSKIEWPSDMDLQQMVFASNYTATGKALGVTGNAVKYRLKRRGLID